MKKIRMIVLTFAMAGCGGSGSTKGKIRVVKKEYMILMIRRIIANLIHPRKQFLLFYMKMLKE